jgi:hypothetical protein
MPDQETKRARRAEYMRKWRAAHPEYREWKRAYDAQRMADPGLRQAAQERAREWYYANRERALEVQKKYNAAKPKLGRRSGEAHPNWAADDVGYDALHRWVVRHKGRLQRCDRCGTTEPRLYEWANVDHKYRRVLEDWVRMCRPCHRRHDYDNGLSAKGSRWRRRSSGEVSLFEQRFGPRSAVVLNLLYK